MCGIAGVIRFARSDGSEKPEERIPGEWLDALDGRIARRGPDARGRFRDHVVLENGVRVDIALVHRRLSIIDPEDGAQPMVSGGTGYKGRVAVVFNGCIYNHRKLREELKSAKHKFHTDHSDTEVLIHGYRHWGMDVAQELTGMFAFAIWDARRGELILARDRSGEKPLYGCNLPSGDGHAFASTPAALEALLETIQPGAEHTITGVVEWISRGASGTVPRDDIFECPPARRARIREEDARPVISSRAYWETPERDQSSHGRLTPDIVERMLEQAVAERMEADVPLGCFLSGGVDSSLVAYFAQKEREKRGKWIETFTIKMPDGRYDESAYAEMVADKIGARHRTIPVKTEAASDLVELIGHLGLPFADSSLLPTYWLCKAARKHVKVALSGDGADELFCGYERYRGGEILADWGSILRLIPKRFFSQKDPKSKQSKMARLVDAARNGGYDDLVAIFPKRDLSRLLARRDRDRVSKRREVVDPATDDFERYLPQDILRKVDTASMACGLEVRSPFLARELIEVCLYEPISSHMRKRELKWLLKQVALRHIPAECVQRPKMGFAAPIGEWFRSGFGDMKTLLWDHLTSADPWPGIDVRIRKRAVKRMMKEHDDGSRDHGQRLYALLVLSIWSQQLKNDGIVKIDPMSPEDKEALDAFLAEAPKPEEPTLLLKKRA